MEYNYKIIYCQFFPMNTLRRSFTFLGLFLFGFAFVFGVSGFFPLTAQAHHTDANPCYDISGTGKVVNVGGVPNSGTISFDDPMAPVHNYQACARKVGSTVQFEGWAWNSNLGWISFRCDNTGSNLGASCGDGVHTYGVTVDSTGKFSGYAWGDNAGWIRFDNGNFSQVRVETQDSSCQGSVYGFTPPSGKTCQHGADVNDGRKWTYAWSDNVGWIDFDGMFVPWYTVQQNITDSNIQIKITPDPSLLGKSTGTPVANGNDEYTVSVKLTGPDGQPLDTSRYNVNMIPQWIDTVKKNQIDPAVQLDNSDCSHNYDKPNALGAVIKPCAAVDFHNSGPGTYSASIKSYAPTSNMNGVDYNNDGLIDFSYEQFIVPTAKTVPPPNNLQLTGVKVAILDNQTLTCVFPDATCTPKLVEPTFAAADASLKFLPQTEVSTLKGPSADNYVNLTVGSLQPFPVQISGPGTVDFQSGIEPSPLFQDILHFVFDNVGASGIAWGQDNGIWNNIVHNVASLNAGVVQNPQKSAPQYVSGLYMWSKVTEGSGSGLVQYYSNKLPRVKGSVAVQPIAVLRGNIYAKGVATTTTTVQQIRTIGDISTNILRDTLYKNVSKIIAGAGKPVSVGQLLGPNGPLGLNLTATLIPDGKGGLKQTNFNPGAITELLPWVVNGVNKGARVYFAHGDIHLGTPAQPITWEGERTLIVMGGSVYIDNNIYNGPGISPKPKLGIIVLQDLNIPHTTAGNVYIAPNVTNIQGVNIAAPDGSVFPYNPALAPQYTNQDGLPTFDASGPNSAEELLKTHQLFFEGSIASQNTIGGSVQDPLLLGNGKTVSLDNDNRRIARLYDLNYLRYYTGILRRDNYGNAQHSDGSDVNSETELRLMKPNASTPTPWSKYDVVNGQGGDLYPPTDPQYGIPGSVSAQGLDPQKDLGSVYIYFDPPTATLPGFSSDNGLNLKQLPR